MRACTDSSIKLFHGTPQDERDFKRSSHPTWFISRVATIKKLFNETKEETLNDEDTFKISSKFFPWNELRNTFLATSSSIKSEANAFSKDRL